MHRQHRYMHSHRKVDQSSSLGRLVPKILHDFQHLHGFPATLNFNIALTHGLEKGLARMPYILHDLTEMQH